MRGGGGGGTPTPRRRENFEFWTFGPVAPHQVRAVSLLGSKAKLNWSQTEEGLVVKLPAVKPCDFAYTLKIVGKGL